MKKYSPMSIKSNESADYCIICLSDVNETSINFPCIFSSCTCKYIMNLSCIQQHNINSCPICRAEIKYSKYINELKIGDFQTETTTTSTTSGRDKIRKLKIVIPSSDTTNVTNVANVTNVTNRYRHETLSENAINTSRNCNRICLICIPFIVVGLVSSMYYFSSVYV